MLWSLWGREAKDVSMISTKGSKMVKTRTRLSRHTLCIFEGKNLFVGKLQSAPLRLWLALD